MISRTTVIRASFVATLALGLAIASLVKLEAGATQNPPGALVLLNNRDAAKLKLTDREWRDVLRARGLQTGPRIIVKKPAITESDGIPTIEVTSPTSLSVAFDDDHSPVDMSTLEVSARKGLFSKSLTVMLQPYIREDALEVSNARIPPGRFLLEVSIADQAGNRTDETYRLEVKQCERAEQIEGSL